MIHTLVTTCQHFSVPKLKSPPFGGLFVPPLRAAILPRSFERSILADLCDRDVLTIGLFVFFAKTIPRLETVTIVRRSYGFTSPTTWERSLGYSTISIRRFSVRPSSVSLLATGLVSAKPTASRLSRLTPPRSMKNRTTFVARAVDNSQFVGNLSRIFTPIGTLSVCPSIRICLSVTFLRTSLTCVRTVQPGRFHLSLTGVEQHLFHHVDRQPIAHLLDRDITSFDFSLQ